MMNPNQPVGSAWNAPQQFVQRLRTLGLEDWTYGNDVCSSMGIMLVQNATEERYIQVFIDAESPEDRECPDYSRFNVADETQRSIVETNDFEVVVRTVAELLTNGD